MAVLTASSSVTFSWTIEVLIFAARQGIAAALDCLVEATLELFPSAQALHVLLLNDPAIRPNGHILIEVQVPHDSCDREEARRLWDQQLQRCCPAPLRHLLRLVVISVRS